MYKVFNDASYTFSLVYIPTSNLFCYTALNIAGALESGLKVPNIALAVGGMRIKWLQYYKVIRDVFLIAFVFYPRYKQTGLQDMLENYFPLLDLDMEEDPLCDVDAIVLRVRRLLDELFTHYSALEGGDEEALLPPAPSSPAHKGKSMFARNIFGSKRAQTRGSSGGRGSSILSSGSELDKYLTTYHEFSHEEMDDKEYAVLEWWSKPDKQENKV